MPIGNEMRFDEELLDALPLAHSILPPEITPDDIERVRATMNTNILGSALKRYGGVQHRNITAHTSTGDELELSVFRHEDTSGNAPVVYYIHGGGMVFGNRNDDADLLCKWASELGVVGVSV